LAGRRAINIGVNLPSEPEHGIVQKDPERAEGWSN